MDIRSAAAAAAPPPLLLRTRPSTQFELDLQASTYAATFLYATCAVGAVLVFTLLLNHFSRAEYEQMRSIERTRLL